VTTSGCVSDISTAVRPLLAEHDFERRNLLRALDAAPDDVGVIHIINFKVDFSTLMGPLSGFRVIRSLRLRQRQCEPA